MSDTPQTKPPTLYFLFEVGNVVRLVSTRGLYEILHHAVDHHDLGRQPMYVYREITTDQVYVNDRNTMESGIFKYYAKNRKAAL